MFRALHSPGVHRLEDAENGEVEAEEDLQHAELDLAHAVVALVQLSCRLVRTQNHWLAAHQLLKPWGLRNPLDDFWQREEPDISAVPLLEEKGSTLPCFDGLCSTVPTLAPAAAAALQK